MKPTKNRVFCNKINRVKMLFPSKEKADNFIAFNTEGISGQSRNVPIRSYYCSVCNGWHVTHKPLTDTYIQKDNETRIGSRLALFIDEIKKSFIPEDWQRWKPLIDEAAEWTKALSENVEYASLVREADRQLTHYIKCVESGERRLKKTLERPRQEQEVSINRILKAIHQNMESLNFDKCLIVARKLASHTENPLFAELGQEVRVSAKRMTDCLLDTDMAGSLRWMVKTIASVNYEMDSLDKDALHVHIQKLRTELNRLEENEVPDCLIQPLRNEVDNISKLIALRKEDVCDSYEKVRLLLLDAVTALEEKDKDCFNARMADADERLKLIPWSAEKMIWMKKFVDIHEASLNMMV